MAKEVTIPSSKRSRRCKNVDVQKAFCRDSNPWSMDWANMASDITARFAVSF